MSLGSIRIKDVSGVLRYRPDTKKWSARNRRTHFIGIQLCGSALHTFKDHSFTLEEGSVYFFNRRDDYDVEVLSPPESVSVHFTTYEEIEEDSFCIPLDHGEEFLSLLQKIEILCNTKDHNELLLLSALYQLCGKLARLQQKPYFKRDEKILAAKEYMDLHFRESDCLCQATRQCGLSARRFNDLFKLSFETTPNRYITLQKIKYAKFLLETGSLRITEIAEHCGFSDVYYFSKVFKDVCGIPPSEWK